MPSGSTFVSAPQDRWSGPMRRSSGPAGPEASAPAGSALGEQSSGELPPLDPTTGATAAAVQIPGLSPEIPHHPRSDPQHLRHPARSDQQTHTSAFPRPSRRRLGGDGCLNRDREGAFRPGAVILAAPIDKPTAPHASRKPSCWHRFRRFHGRSEARSRGGTSGGSSRRRPASRRPPHATARRRAMCRRHSLPR